MVHIRAAEDGAAEPSSASVCRGPVVLTLLLLVHRLADICNLFQLGGL